jgi:hypothetical protein
MLERALAEARGFEATASASQTEWTRKALCRTACISYVAIEACEMAAQAGWDPRKCGTYHDLLDREELKLYEAFGNMMPDELPVVVVAAAEVRLDDAYGNITLAHACMTARREQEEERLATQRASRVAGWRDICRQGTRLWILRALQQTSCVSHMAQEICDDSTKAKWSTWSYREYRRLLDEEMLAVCRI